MAAATGEWIIAVDPDDMLDPHFFKAAQDFAEAHPDIEIMGSNVWNFNEAQGRKRNNHPRRGQFAAGSRVVNLDRHPNIYPGSGTVAFLKLDRIRSLGLSYDTALRPSFEDAHLSARYILSLEKPMAGLLADAVYLYRKRVASDSTMQRSFAHPGRYTTVLARGYLDLFRIAKERKGRIPAWLQHLVIYDLSWYLREHDAPATRLALPPKLEDRFHELLGEVVRSLDPEVVEHHTVTFLLPVWVDLLAHAYRDPAWSPSEVDRGYADTAMRLERLAYRYAGDRPAEQVIVDGAPVEPAWAKTRALTYFNRTPLHERILWVPMGRSLEVRLDGAAVEIRAERRRTKVARYRPAKGSRRGRLKARAGDTTRRIREAGTRLLARTLFRRRYRDAWVLLDRMTDADDNAERLFEHVRRERPDINAWFVVLPGTPDFNRLRHAGEPRLVAYGSFAWTMLMLNAIWVISSHADEGVAAPPQILDLVGAPTWKFGFLQHGITKDDLSTWLNARRMDLFVVSTEPELASVAGDGTSYVVTAKETRNTGLPRFDRLRAKAAGVPEADQDMVIVAPTWRTWLTLPNIAREHRRELRDEFWTSEYMTAWMAILNSAEITAAARRRGWRLGFMPHPNFQHVLGEMSVPDHVVALAFAGSDVQELYARCPLLITDYSSVAFNLAYIDRPIVYYQFDRDRVLGGGHIGRKGYFEYERDGFGPVVMDHAAAVAAIIAAIDHGPRPAPEYAARIAATFPTRDGHACDRVVAAVEELSRPWVGPSHS